jgi:hypothetical protein
MRNPCKRDVVRLQGFFVSWIWAVESPIHLINWLAVAPCRSAISELGNLLPAAGADQVQLIARAAAQVVVVFVFIFAAYVFAVFVAPPRFAHPLGPFAIFM